MRLEQSPNNKMPGDGQKMRRRQTLLLPLFIGRLPDEEKDVRAVTSGSLRAQPGNAPYFRMQRTALTPSVQRTFLPCAYVRPW